MSKEMIVRLNEDRVKINGCEYVQDLIRCKDCKHYTESDHKCSVLNAIVTDMFYCRDGEEVD